MPGPAGTRRRGAIARLARNKLGEDITVPRSAIPEMVARLAEIGRANDLEIVVYGHIGDGNLHPTILCDRYDRQFPAAAQHQPVLVERHRYRITAHRRKCRFLPIHRGGCAGQRGL